MKKDESDKQEGHWIIPGDWIIRVPPTAEEERWKNNLNFDPFGLMGGGQEDRDLVSFTDHAIWVIDATKAHLTVYDPVVGRPIIFALCKYPGDWHHATRRQVETTWNLAAASGNRSRESLHNLGDERNKYPYRDRRRG